MIATAHRNDVVIFLFIIESFSPRTIDGLTEFDSHFPSAADIAQSRAVYDHRTIRSRISLRNACRGGDAVERLFCARVTLVLIAVLLLASGAFALDAGRALTQSRLSVWT